MKLKPPRESVLDRFERYVRIDTRSEEDSDTYPSTAKQWDLLNLLKEICRSDNAQFIIATHSPILLACPDAHILTFDEIPVKQIAYENTDQFRIYKDFMADPQRFAASN